MTKEELLQTYFYIEDISGSTNTVSITKNNSSAPTLKIEYSTDGITWTTQTMNTNTTANTFTIPANGKLYLRGVNTQWCSISGYDYYNKITATGNHNVGGNIMSLLYGNEFEGKEVFPTTNDYVLCGLFFNNSTLVSSKDLILPATTLANYCYYQMFGYCTSLTTAPELPATTLANYCYYQMFYNCSSLTTAPELPATTLTHYCYYNMFYYCSKLNYIKADFIDYNWNNCDYWVYGVSSTGTFVINPEATYNPASIVGDSGIPYGWTVINPNQRSITVLSNNTKYGTVSGSGTYNLGETVTITAVPTYKGKFVSWSDGNTERTRTIEITEDLPDETTYTAIFEEVQGGFYFINESENTNTLTVTNTDKNLQYSTDNITWTDIVEGTTTIEFEEGIIIKGVNTSLDGVNFQNSEFTKVEGKLVTLLYGDDVESYDNVIPEDSINTFKGLFKNNTNLVDNSGLVLPENTTKGCYTYMFQGGNKLGQTYMKENPLYSEYFYIQDESGSDGVIEIRLYWSQWPDMDMYYSYDKKTWTPVEWITPRSSGYAQIPLYSFGKIYIKQMNKYGFVATSYGWVNISTSNTYSVGGNIMSLLYGDNFTNIDLNDSETIPATSFQGLFFNDNSVGQLIHAHDLILPVLSLSTYCYSGMFYNCSYLTTAPILPATSLNDYCYHLMFNGCTQLEKLQMKYSGRVTDTYYVVDMFNTVKGCVNGTFECPSNIQYDPYTFLPSNWEVVYNDNIPNVVVNAVVYNNISSLPATELAPNCYHHMFTGCTSLKSIPELPADNLTNSCYHGMFMGCDGINKVSLPEVYLAPYAYSNMFLGTHNLSDVTVTYNENIDETNYKGWLNGVSVNGKFTYNHTEEVDSNIIQTHYHVPDNWNINYNDPNAVINYFYIEDISGSDTQIGIPVDNMTFWMYQDDMLEQWETLNLEYSYDTVEWDTVELDFDNGITWIDLPANSKVYLRGNNKSWNSAIRNVEFLQEIDDCIYEDVVYGLSWDGRQQIVTLSECNVGGDILTLMYGEEIPDTIESKDLDCAFMFLFDGYEDLDGNWHDSYVVDASKLILPDVVGINTYNSMFYECISLTTAPELPATTLAEGCYSYMFQGCWNLTKAPELPATTLAEGCYCDMFCNCRSLTTAPILPAITLTTECYCEMFSGCTSLTTAPELPATTLAEDCYSYMFQGCWNLTKAPELPATNLVDWCYEGMFFECTSLTTAPELPATTLAEGCYCDMFGDCISLTTAPELPATTLTTECYYEMFYDCSSLTEIYAPNVNTWDWDACESWVNNVADEGIMHFNTRALFDSIGGNDNTGGSSIPGGWTAYIIETGEYIKTEWPS